MPRRATPGGAGAAHRLEYERRVNRVIDHVRRHLAEELSLAGLARVAAFSPFHFHRVFTAITGETPFGFIQRLRIERAAVALRDRPDESVLAVALDHGFSSPATFARAFRARFAMSATQWRAGGAERWRERERRRNARKQVRTARKARGRGPARTRAMRVQVKPLPAFHVAAMRHVGPYGAGGIPALWERLMTWMETHGLAPEATTRLGVAYDDPAVTRGDRLRYDACVVVPADFGPDRWVDVTDFPAGRYAVSEFRGRADAIVGAWDAIFRAWLPGSGYQPDDRPCIEVYRGRPMVEGQPGTFRCDLCLPIRPL